jgi:hypothetical protein
LGLPQQQSRHTTIRQGTGPVAVGSFGSSVVAPVGVAGMARRSSLRGDPPRWFVEEATA